MTSRRGWSRLLFDAALVAILGFFLFPFLWMVQASSSPV